MDPTNEQTRLLPKQDKIPFSPMNIQDPPRARARTNSGGSTQTATSVATSVTIDTDDPLVTFANLPFYKRYFNCFFPSARPPMPPEKKLTASWLEKWIKYLTQLL
jgi:hypothetical protein